MTQHVSTSIHWYFNELYPAGIRIDCGWRRAQRKLLAMRFLALSLISFLLPAGATCFAQAGSSPNSVQSTGVPPPAESDEQRRNEQLKKEEKQRVFGILPEFNVSRIPDAVALTPKQKFGLAFKTLTDPGTFFFDGVVAGIAQAQNSFPGYGQGVEGYAKRFGATYVDSFDGAMIGNAMLPTILHQDPRYFRRGKGNFTVRIGYAVLSTFRCKSDSGHWQPNYSNILGNFAAGAISNVYYPENQRGLTSTYQRAIVVSAQGAIGASISEFWPDIAQHLHKRHS
jgi:hypothetical protein